MQFWSGFYEITSAGYGPIRSGMDRGRGLIRLTGSYRRSMLVARVSQAMLMLFGDSMVARER